MSSLRLVKRGKYWHIVLSFQDDAGEWQQKWESTHETDRAAAEEVLHDRRTQMRAGIRLQDNPTVGEWLTAWLRDVLSPVAPKPLAPMSAQEYERIVVRDLIPRIGKIGLRDLKPSDVQSLMAELLTSGLPGDKPMSRSTVRYRHAVLRASLHEAERQGLVLRNAAALARSPQLEQKVQPALRPDEARLLIQANPENPWTVFAELGLLTGMRFGELLGLHWDDIDFAASTIYVTRQLQRQPHGGGVVERPVKSKAGVRLIALPARGVELLQSLRAIQAREGLQSGAGAPVYVFGHRHNGHWQPWSPEAANEHLHGLYEQAGIARPTQPTHILRHTHITAASGVGMPVKDMQQRAGHSDPKVTLEIYAKANVEGQRAGAERVADLLLPPRAEPPATKGGEGGAV